MARSTTTTRAKKTPASKPAGPPARAGSNRQAARARAKRGNGTAEPSAAARSAGDGRRPGTEVWSVAQENAWHASERGLPPRRGSG